jgi:hypothetical protein
MKWVELKAGKELPEGWVDESIDSHMGRVEQFRDPKTAGLTLTDPRTEALRDALRYEGDTMGNCVGGYCDKVAGGQSRVFSLRDKKGQPHVTIETQKNDRVPMHAAIMEHMRANDPAAYDQGNGLAYDLAYDEAIRNLEKNALETIKQIKGSGKKDSMQRIRMANTGYADNPDAHLVPYIQDFVKSGKWSDVRNLDHAGLRRLVPESDVGRSLKEFGRELPPYVSEDEMAQLLDWSNGIRKDLPEGFSRGGSVYSPARVDEIVTQHRNSEYDPARVDALVAQLKEEMYG